MIFLIIIFILFLIIWFILSYFVARQLNNYGFVGDATKTAASLYWIISGAIIFVSFLVILII